VVVAATPACPLRWRAAASRAWSRRGGGSAPANAAAPGRTLARPGLDRLRTARRMATNSDPTAPPVKSAAGPAEALPHGEPARSLRSPPRTTSAFPMLRSGWWPGRVETRRLCHGNRAGAEESAGSADGRRAAATPHCSPASTQAARSARREARWRCMFEALWAAADRWVGPSASSRRISQPRLQTGCHGFPSASLLALRFQAQVRWTRAVESQTSAAIGSGAGPRSLGSLRGPDFPSYARPGRLSLRLRHAGWPLAGPGRGHIRSAGPMRPVRLRPPLRGGALAAARWRRGR
jgi:hypothetical protein